MEYIAILVIMLITFSVIFLPNQWDFPTKQRRKHTNHKYIIPAEFWVEYNEMLRDINNMTQSNARVVFQKLNQLNERYCRFYMNYTFDEKMTQLIEKYNERINYFHNNKTN